MCDGGKVEWWNGGMVGIVGEGGNFEGEF